MKRTVGKRQSKWTNRLFVAESLESRQLLAGVTLITHGFESNIDGWARAMAEAVDAKPNVDGAIYVMTATDHGNTDEAISVSNPDPRAGTAPDATANPEIIILLDWSVMAGSLPLGGHYRSTVDVAAKIAEKLLTPNIIPGVLNLVALPFHLIGHSRGGSLVAELARNLGQQGLWVDQLTTLDPHPVNSLSQGGNWGDAPIDVTDNVVFADNYWQDGDGLITFGGQSIRGSNEVHLDQRMLDREDPTVAVSADPGYSLLQGGAHSDVHLWYHGTIAQTASGDGQAVMPIGSHWYDASPRVESGFYYSSIVGGPRTSGIGGRFGGGTTYRASTDTAGWVWPNVLLNSPSLPLQSDGWHVNAGETIDVPYYYNAGKTVATLRFGTDGDQNPLNDGFSYLTPAASASPSVDYPQQHLNWSPTSANSGRYLFAEITDTAGHARYSYLSRKFVVDPAADTTPPTATLYNPINGSSIAQSAINANKYIHITFSDSAGSGLNFATITDAGQEFSISGLTINGTPTLLSGTTYQYSFTGSLPLGTISVIFPFGAWADNAGNLNQAFTQTFTVSAKPVITYVTPVLQPLPADQTQLITLSGTGFSSASTLSFVSALGNSYTGRTPTFDAATGTLRYYISVGTTQGQWWVQVVTNGVASDPFPFTVSNAVATPTISPGGGEFSVPVQVSLFTTTTNATIRYTKDGTDPTASSPVYPGSFTINSTTIVKARAFKSGMPDSAIASATFSINTSIVPSINLVSPASLQPLSSQPQTVTVYGSGFNNSSNLEFFDPNGIQRITGSTSFVNSTQLTYLLVVNGISGTWTVRVKNVGGHTSGTYSFRVAEPPATNAPTLLSPADGETNVPGTRTLKWQAVPGADLYRLMVASDPAKLPRNPNETVGADLWNQAINASVTEITIENQVPGRTEYWQVNARISNVWYAWSPIFRYTVAGELNVPPVVSGISVSPSPVVQGGKITFIASGVYDRNFNNTVKWVQFIRESNGIPGLQADGNNTDSWMATDSDGSDGWSATASTFGLAARTYTVYASAMDSFDLRSMTLPTATLTIQPANLPAPRILNIDFNLGMSPPTIFVQFNVDVSPTVNVASFVLDNPFFSLPQTVSYDSATNMAILRWSGSLPSGDNGLNAWAPNSITNAAGVSLTGPTWFGFSFLLGDANNDRCVDSQDYTLLLRNLNTGDGRGWSDGDFDANGLVDAADLQILQSNLGQSLPPLAGAPNQPVNSSPADNAATVALVPILQAGAFSDPNADDTHAASQWVVTRVSDSIVVLNSGEDPTSKTTITIGSLTPSTAYTWKVRYKDNKGVWSSYSNPTTFTTMPLVVPEPPIAHPGGPYIASLNTSLTLDGSLSSDPNPRETLSYAWDLNNDGLFDDATGPKPLFFPTTPGIHTLSLRVTNSAGLASTTSTTAKVYYKVLQGDLFRTNTDLTVAESWIKLGYLYSSSATPHTTLAPFPQPDGSILVQLTYYGDTNNDGTVNLTDYFTIDSGYLNQRQGFTHGDVNLDGEINLTDYFLIDSAYLNQQPPLASSSSSTRTKQVLKAPKKKPKTKPTFSSKKRIH